MNNKFDKILLDAVKLSKTFIFQNESYDYFYQYNTTWNNEREVEIPIVWQMIQNNSSQNILEVGNVLSHYFSVEHEVLDKYEQADDVINQDAVDFHPDKKYDLIVSISTLEHVGWDEETKEPMKILCAIENLKKLLVQNGKMVVTLPIGYNSVMDELLKEGKIQFTKMYCMKRISENNEWIEVDWNDIVDIKYNYPFICANGLVIGIIEKTNEK